MLYVSRPTIFYDNDLRHIESMQKTFHTTLYKMTCIQINETIPNPLFELEEAAAKVKAEAAAKVKAEAEPASSPHPPPLHSTFSYNNN